MTKILIIEDEESVRKPLEDHLKREGYTVVVSQTGFEGDRRLAENPDLIIADWMLPDIQGIELLKKWRASGVLTPVIMLTARTELVDKVVGLELGANDYMTKPFEPRELVARIRTQLRGRQMSSPQAKNEEIVSCGVRLSLNTREVYFKDLEVDLTKTEFDLLRLFMENPNQVFSREEILKKVWGYESYPTTRTVDTHVLQLRQKFSSHFFETVHGIGYRFREKI
jgi:DNA-binding response OmpR family regulator